MTPAGVKSNKVEADVNPTAEALPAKSNTAPGFTERLTLSASPQPELLRLYVVPLPEKVEKLHVEALAEELIVKSVEFPARPVTLSAKTIEYVIAVALVGEDAVVVIELTVGAMLSIVVLEKIAS